jgi:hypothetical protein
LLIIVSVVQVFVRTIAVEDDNDEPKAATQPPVYHEDKEVNARLKTYLEKMREGLATVQLQQRRDRNRLSLNSETNRASHNGMVMGSIVETLIFILASLFQVNPACLPACLHHVHVVLCDSLQLDMHAD